MTIRRAVAAALLVGALGSGSASAQHPRAPIGVQIGYSRAEFGGPAGGRLGGREGALAGAYLTAGITGGWAVQPEVLFALKGGRLQGQLQGGGGSAPLDIELAYIELPILAKWFLLHDRGHIHPVLFGGPAPSFRLGCDVQLTLDTGPLRAACEDIENLAFKRMDFGIAFGGGVQRDWAETALALEVRYTVGFPSILGSAADVRNRQLGVMLALNF